MSDLMEEAQVVIRWLDMKHYDHSKKVVERLVARIKELEQPTVSAEDEVERLGAELKDVATIINQERMKSSDFHYQDGLIMWPVGSEIKIAKRLLAAGLTFREQAEAPQQEAKCTCPTWDDPAGTECALHGQDAPRQKPAATEPEPEMPRCPTCNKPLAIIQGNLGYYVRCEVPTCPSGPRQTKFYATPERAIAAWAPGEYRWADWRDAADKMGYLSYPQREAFRLAFNAARERKGADNADAK
jgi:hypothetical protein